MTENSTRPRIAIVGGGVGGPTLARILQVNGIPATVYEAEVSVHARTQGGGLNPQAELGLHALRRARLQDELAALVRPEGRAQRVLDKHGTVLLEEEAEDADGEMVEVDRRDLRTMLLESLDEGTVRWDKKLDRAVPLGDGRHALHFRDGSTATCDLLVGADGAWSRVRPLLTDARPVYAGATMIEIGLPDAEHTRPELARFVGHGSLWALQDHKGLMAQRNGDGRIRIDVVLRVAEDWLTTSAIPFDRPERARRMIADQFAGWHPRLRDLVTSCDDVIWPRPVHMLPIGLTWQPRPGVTLIGDAAHLMSPFAGAGSNLALRDAADLADAVVGADGDLAVATAAYESVMFPRAAQYAAEADRNLELFLSAHGSRAFCDLMTGVRSGAAG